MKKQTAGRTRFVGLRFTPEEFALLESRRKASITPQISEYLRRLIFNRPIKMGTRNQSLDDFMEEMIRLRTELNHIGNNFNQAVKKLNCLEQQLEFSSWLKRYDADRQMVVSSIEAVKEKINQISDQWLQ